MRSAAALTLCVEATEEAKAYLRIHGTDEDALTARLIRSAAELAERFTGRTLVAREFTEVLRASAAWQRLAASPVRAILGVETWPVEGTAAALPAEAYTVDIDAAGEGWVRLTAPVDAPRVRVRFEAGLAMGWAELPEPLPQGAVWLAAHLYTHRDDAGGAGPPAAVRALWRPYRKLRIA